MLSKEEWNANKDSTSIIYCFEDGTTKEITMAEYLRAHPEHSAEDFRIIKELSDELLYHDYHSDNYHGYWKADKDFSGLAALVPSPEPGPLESLLRKEQLRFAFSCSCAPAAQRQADSCTAPLLLLHISSRVKP